MVTLSDEQVLNGSSLLMGWDAGQTQEFGFSKSVDRSPRPPKMVQYKGDSHLISFGPTGSGKGRGVLVPNLLNYEGTTVVVDLKNGELTRLTSRRRRELGPVYVIDPFNITDGPRAEINPFDMFSWPGAMVDADAEMLADVFSMGNKGVKDPFWDQHGRGLLAAVICYVATLPKPERTIGKVIDMLMADDVVYNLAVLLDTVGKKIPKMAYREIATFLQMPDVTRGGVLATTLSYLKTFHGESVLNTFSTSGINLRDFINGKPMTIYIVLPVDRLHSHAALLKLTLGLLLKAIVTRRSRPETRTLMLIDECGQLGTFPFLETFITLCRGFGCWAWTFWQDLAQLQTYYPTAWKTILNNCGVVQAFGFNNRDLAEQWSNYFDSNADSLRQIASHEQVLMISGAGEYRGARLDYLQDPLFAGLFDDNPMYTTGQAMEDVPEPQPDQPEAAKESEEPEEPKKKPGSHRGGGGGDGGLQAR